MKQQLLDAWATNQRMNVLVIDNTTDEAMQHSLSTRGRTIYQQWVHVHNVRMQWLEICAKDIHKKYVAIDKEAPVDRKTLVKSLADSSKGITELFGRSWDEGGKVKGFKTGLIPMLSYFVAHESHHRGNILLTLKQSGEKIPDTLKWGLWDWGK